MPSQIPILETERLVLRGHERDDLSASMAMWRDPVVLRHIDKKPASLEEAWWRVLGYVGHWSLRGFGFWAVFEAQSERFVGEVGFGEFKRGMSPSFDGVPECGWVLAPWAHGIGFATEALTAVHSWGDDNLGSDRTVCLVGDENRASLRVASRLGYEEFDRAPYRGQPSILMQRRRPQGND